MTTIGFAKSPLGALIFQTYARVVHGLSFRIALGPDEDALYKFRFALYSDEGYINRNSYPDKKFSDKYDPVSVSVIAMKGKEIVGAGRATHYSEHGLPTFEYFNIALENNISRESIVEMGRFMVHPDYRGNARIVSLGLSLQLKKYLSENPDVRWLLAFMPDKVRRAFSALVPFQVLKQLPLEASHLQARGLLPGYWEQADIFPVMAKASSLLSNL